MLNKLQYDWKERSIFWLMILMVAGLFFSRVLLSVSMGVFVALCLLHRQLPARLRFFFRSPLLIGITLLFFLPLLTGFWSTDTATWLQAMRIKLPLLLLPLAFAASFQLNDERSRWIGMAFIFFTVAGTCWSVYQYFQNAQSINEGYLRAKSLVTPLQNDHIRFSWAVSFSILLSGIILSRRLFLHRAIVIMLIVSMSWQVIYLHILAARTGLFCLYGGAIFIALRQLMYGRRQQRAMLLGILVCIIALPVAAYLFLPSFHNRVRYMYYDYGYFRNAHYLEGGNDATRVISLKAGWSLMSADPVSGVGFGDVHQETRAWYEKKFPQMKPADQLLPSSEWLMYGAGAGITGFLLFSLVMALPFFSGPANKYWWLLNAAAAFSLLFDIGLETQFGVFLYVFPVLWLWKWFVGKP